MIQRIELVNFMSHTHTVIEPAPGLTVLVGPNNCGKSAVVAALRILCHNENSTYVTRHDERSCSVLVQTDDGHTIEWRRKNAPSYVIDGRTFDRLKGTGLPDELHQALRLPLVAAANDQQTFDVHFGEQKAPIFLLDQPGSCAATFFASSSDAIRLVEMQQLHRRKIDAARNDKARLEKESKQLNDELEVLSPLPEVDVRLRALEQTHAELQAEVGAMEAVRHAALGLEAASAALAYRNATTSAMGPLTEPPVLADTEPLNLLVARLIRADANCARAKAQRDVVARLESLPPLDDDSALARLLTEIRAQSSLLRRAEHESAALAALPEVPQFGETDSLADLIVRLRETTAAATLAERRCQHLRSLGEPPPLTNDALPLAEMVAELRDALADLNARSHDAWSARAELITWEKEHPFCPTCGAALDSAHDSDRLHEVAHG